MMRALLLYRLIYFYFVQIFRVISSSVQPKDPDRSGTFPLLLLFVFSHHLCKKRKNTLHERQIAGSEIFDTARWLDSELKYCQSPGNDRSRCSWMLAIHETTSFERSSFTLPVPRHPLHTSRPSVSPAPPLFNDFSARTFPPLFFR